MNKIEDSMSNEDRINKIADVMADLGFEQVQTLKFRNEEYKKQINDQIDSLDIDLDTTSSEPTYELAIDEDDIVIEIPDEEIYKAESTLNSGNPDTVDAHPLALMFMMTRRTTVSSISKEDSPIDDELFWIDNYEKVNKNHFFTYDDINFRLTPDLSEELS